MSKPKYSLMIEQLLENVSYIVAEVMFGVPGIMAGEMVCVIDLEGDIYDGKRYLRIVDYDENGAMVMYVATAFVTGLKRVEEGYYRVVLGAPFGWIHADPAEEQLPLFGDTNDDEQFQEVNKFEAGGYEYMVTSKLCTAGMGSGHCVFNLTRDVFMTECVYCSRGLGDYSGWDTSEEE